MAIEADKTLDSRLASQCQGVASCLSYNGDRREAEAKHTLIEASHRLDYHACRLSNDGSKVANARGKFRRMTICERLAVWLLGGRLEVRP